LQTQARISIEVPFFTGPMPIRDILWSMIIFHNIHHRGQLSLMCRPAGQAPGLCGPNREETRRCERVQQQTNSTVLAA
jgi:uncharacterized damage-inducible protein DinB